MGEKLCWSVLEAASIARTSKGITSLKQDFDSFNADVSKTLVEIRDQLGSFRRPSVNQVEQLSQSEGGSAG